MMNLISSQISKAYIVILNWNQKSDTLACIQSLLKLPYELWQIVVVDNGSSDGSPFIENKRNLGCSVGSMQFQKAPSGHSFWTMILKFCRVF